MSGAYKSFFSMVLAISLGSLSACASLQSGSSYNPDGLWQRTSCVAPLILRHKTKAAITTLDKENRLIAIGLNLYDGSSKGVDLSGSPTTYTDIHTKGEACPQKDITTHYVTSIADFESYVEAKRDIRPIYVRHLKSSAIEGDKNIKCSGIYSFNDMLDLNDKTLTMPSYNEELCWVAEL